MVPATERRRIADTVGRVVAIVIAVLLMGVSAILGLMVYAVLDPSSVRNFTDYQGLLNQVDKFSQSQSTTGKTVFGIVSALIALMALVLLLMLLFYRPRIKRSVVQSEPGRETVIRPRAVQHLAEGAARSARAVRPEITMRSRRKGVQDVSCRFQAVDFVRVPFQANHVRDTITDELRSAGVRVGRVEAIVRGSAPKRTGRKRVL